MSRGPEGPKTKAQFMETTSCQNLTLIGHYFVHSTSCHSLDEGEVTPSKHLLLQSSSLIVVICRPGQNFKDGQNQRHEHLLQEGRHLPLP